MLCTSEDMRDVFRPIFSCGDGGCPWGKGDVAYALSTLLIIRRHVNVPREGCECAREPSVSYQLMH